MLKYTTIKEVIKEVKKAREVQKERGILSAYAEEHTNLVVDAIPFLESLEEYEIVGEEMEFYNYDTDSYKEVDGTTYFKELEDNGELEEVSHVNSYNWDSPISNHLDFVKYVHKETDEIFLEMMVHLGGDPRGNYTDYVLLKFNCDRDYDEALFESRYYGTEVGGKSLYFEDVAYKGQLYDVTIDSYWDNELARVLIHDRDGSNVYSGDEYVGLELDDIKAKIMEILADVVE